MLLQTSSLSLINIGTTLFLDYREDGQLFLDFIFINQGLYGNSKVLI